MAFFLYGEVQGVQLVLWRRFGNGCCLPQQCPFQKVPVSYKATYGLTTSTLNNGGGVCSMQRQCWYSICRLVAQSLLAYRTNFASSQSTTDSPIVTLTH